ncbi:hypothetical protein JI747_013835 [Chryseobacterium sp. RG1]|uniref:GLPGLI family protein n=1 Tax=Chryseobacterium tagetis TaxID=2801334 RepID=A0ABS8A2R0_9FLAO|nr:hypothetical protein [Chryseobacterium tagetis]MCA6068271.1 hypothetical protein [Chryseobacterium tagetis]
MRKIIICFFVLIFGNIYSQNKKKDDLKKLIDSAIVIKANDLYRFYNKELKKNRQDDNWNIYINNLENTINNTYVIDHNSSSVKLENIKVAIPLKTIDIEDHKNRKLLKKGINIWKIIPNLNGSVLTINILDASLHLKNKKYEFSYGGGSTIIFQYSCEEEKWKLIKEEHKGI